MGKEYLSQATDCEANSDVKIPDKGEELGTYSRHSVDSEAGLATCRVCQCAESDKRGDAVLGYLGISPSPPESHKINGEEKADDNKQVQQDVERANPVSNNIGRESQVVEFISAGGEVVICDATLEMGLHQSHDRLIELGCACKNDLALVHYACALKWFVNRGTTVCEICGSVALNIKISDFVKVIESLKEYEALRERPVRGEPNPGQVHATAGLNPDSVAANHRQQLTEISLWFGQQSNGDVSNPASILHIVSEQPLNSVTEASPMDNRAIRWAVEGTGILLATGVLTAIIVWLIAPRVGKKTAQDGLHILLGGVCALSIVVFFRFFVITRLKYGHARFWAILFIFWFVVYGIWASRTHDSAK